MRLFILFLILINSGRSYASGPVPFTEGAGVICTGEASLHGEEARPYQFEIASDEFPKIWIISPQSNGYQAYGLAGVRKTLGENVIFQMYFQGKRIERSLVLKGIGQASFSSYTFFQNLPISIAGYFVNFGKSYPLTCVISSRF